MRRFLKSRVIEWMAVGIASYWLFAPFVPNDLLFTIINGGLMALWIGILISYWKGTWIAVREPMNPLGARLQITAIALLALAITCLFSWAWVYEALDQPLWMRNHLIRGWITWMFLVATVMLLAVGAIKDRSFMPPDSWFRWGVMATLALLLTVAIIYTVGGFS